jgi:hypothetical protein
MGSSELSHTLLDLDFFCAIGTMQKVGGQDVLVVAGESRTWDRNNGILVIHDDEGRPWIKHQAEGGMLLATLQDTYNLRRGAHVPHSNDGGRFVAEVLPALGLEIFKR